VTYTYNDFDLNWSFEVPEIITTDTMITSFLSFNIVPGGGFDTPACDGATPSVELLNPQSLGLITTLLTFGGGVCNDTAVLGPLTTFGVYKIDLGEVTIVTLTISQSGLPEPSSLLLLAGGLTFLLGLRRKQTV
jgi:hypothetical protein